MSIESTETQVQIKPGQVIVASEADQLALLKVQITTPDGRVVVTRLGDRMRPVLTNKDTILNGGEVNGWKILPLREQEEKS